MQARLFNDNIEKLRPLAEAWQKETNANDFGIKSDDFGKYLADLQDMAYATRGNLIVLYDEDEPIGYIGLRYFSNPMGDQVIANEHYFYVLPEHRGIASMRLIKTAKMTAQLRGCSHIIFNASKMASDLHDMVCKLYGKLGMKHWETSYICELGE